LTITLKAASALHFGGGAMKIVKLLGGEFIAQVGKWAIWG
jgi:hypothetical protein